MFQKSIVHRTSCRICGGPLTSILDLGPMYLQGLFVKEGYPQPPKRKVPLELMWCNTTKNEKGCGLVQLSKTVSQDILYSTYWYRSGTNSTMKAHLKDIADMVTNYLLPNRLSAVLDIGCNDGTMLSYYPDTFLKFGVDPSNSIDEIQDINITKIKDVFPSKELEGKTFSGITSIAMLYDLENPVAFVKEIYNKLRNNGIWVFEMSYLPTMMQMNAFDTICNEHIEYYSLSVIETLLDMGDMKLIDATLNSTNGGSIQCTAVKKMCDCYPVNNKNLTVLRELEFEMEMDTIAPYSRFADRVKIITANLLRLLHKIKANGQTIHLYGASTKGNTLLQASEIDSFLVPYAADRNPDKWGAKTLGTDIEIISEEESRAMKPDYYLVLPWHFKEEMLIREKETMENGTKMIFPLPEIEIYP